MYNKKEVRQFKQCTSKNCPVEGEISIFRRHEKNGILGTEPLAAYCHRNGIKPNIQVIDQKNHLNTLFVGNGYYYYYILEGRALLTYSNSSFELFPGDSAYFDAHIPHRIETEGKATTYLSLEIQ